MARKWLQSVDLEVDEAGRPLFEAALIALADLIADGRLRVDAAGVTLTADLIDLDVQAITGAAPDSSTLFDLAALLTAIGGDTASMGTDIGTLAGVDFATEASLAQVAARLYDDGYGLSAADILLSINQAQDYYLGDSGTPWLATLDNTLSTLLYDALDGAPWLETVADRLFLAGPDLGVADLLGRLHYNNASDSPLYMPGPMLSLSEGLQAVLFNSPMMGGPFHYNSALAGPYAGAPLTELVGDLVSGDANIIDSPLFAGGTSVASFLSGISDAVDDANVRLDTLNSDLQSPSALAPFPAILDELVLNSMGQSPLYDNVSSFASLGDMFYDVLAAVNGSGPGPFYDSGGSASLTDHLSLFRGDMDDALFDTVGGSSVADLLAVMADDIAAIKAKTDEMNFIAGAHGGALNVFIDTEGGA